MHRSNNGGYGALTASPSVFEENESCGDACARQLPSLEWIKAYDFAWLWNDVAGGITLGLVLLATLGKGGDDAISIQAAGLQACLLMGTLYSGTMAIRARLVKNETGEIPIAAWVLDFALVLGVGLTQREVVARVRRRRLGFEGRRGLGLEPLRVLLAREFLCR